MFREGSNILSAIKELFWGIPTVALIAAFSLYFTYRLIRYRITDPKRIIRDLGSSLFGGSKNGISPFSAVATALGGTVGVGSILGVGYGIATGGAGSVFWMWVCSFLSMGLKYSEVRIALNGKDDPRFGGTPFRLKKLGYRKLSALFCVLCVLSSFGTGNLTQMNAVSGALADKFPRAFVGAICAVMLGIAVFGGRKRIARVNTFLVPAASAVYLAVCGYILFAGRSGIGNAFSEIFENAFGLSAAVGGFSGALISRAVREGFARSVFSNEAGMGSSSLAHASSDGSSPHVQGEWGMFEIFFDSFVVSTLTALCLLSFGESDCLSVFTIVFGQSGAWLLGILVLVFAFASVISWCFYAECCLSCLGSGKRGLLIYRFFAVAASFAGAFISAEAIWETADILNALMLIPNLFLLFICRNEITQTKR